MKLSVILLTWNSQQHIEACLNSLISSIAHLDYEVIVVDNGSTDNTLVLLQAYTSSKFKLLTNSRNLGVAKSRNQALSLASGEYVLILDIDTVVNRAAIDAMLAYSEQNPETGICACKLCSASGEVQLSCRKFPSIRYKLYNLMEGRGMKVKANQSQFYLEEMNSDKAFESEYVIGACQLVRSKAIEQVGLLDEQIFYGPEDADFCMRMKQFGWKVIYLPTVSIIHHYQQISNKKIFSKMSFLHAKALMYYFLKHRSL